MKCSIKTKREKVFNNSPLNLILLNGTLSTLLAGIEMFLSVSLKIGIVPFVDIPSNSSRNLSVKFSMTIEQHQADRTVL
jgi:hypothetical protein